MTDDVVRDRVRAAVRVEGVVQGVGFRPFVYSLATSLGLSGLVGNDVDGVFAEVEGSGEAVAKFLVRLEHEAPPLARIEAVTTQAIGVTGTVGFVIVPSVPGGQRRTLVSADSATCADCLRELTDPADRRYQYPFINCTNCGPRFTIVRDVPYDRPLTTMSGFTMCARCAAEYRDPADRRFHAQPVCCPDCGPRLSLVDAAGAPVPGADPIAAAAELLRSGRVLAVKGLGGYHLVVDAGHAAASAALRARKHREDKPFAVLVADLEAARQLCEVDDVAAQSLASARRPIVLLPRLPAADRLIAGAVAPGNRHLGLMLPYTPVHYLLLAATARPLVATSGNVSDEPIAFRDADALDRLAGIADAFLLHDRGIHIRTDDSVVRTFGGRESVLRRSRGYVPEPIRLARPVPRPILACGAELKNTFCLAKAEYAVVSHHIGDLENAETLRSFTDGIAHFRRLFDIEPRLVAHDLHPDYLSTKYAVDLANGDLAGDDLADVELVGVQHHHAHVASCLADNEADGPVIGVAFDGTGYGADGTIWGGEFLIADLISFERAGCLEPVSMPGGAAAIRQPWRMAAAYLAVCYPDGPPAGLAVRGRNEQYWTAVTAMAARGINAPLTSSAGRLFDAVAALVGVRDVINYEGQAAIELEQLADVHERGSYPVTVTSQAPPGTGGTELRVAGSDLVQAAAEDLAAGVPAAVIAARFHNGVAGAIVTVCGRLREQTGLTVVALSGGVFQNLLLTSQVVARLTDQGFGVLVHSRVPCNDGGISLGQAAVAGARDRLARGIY
ncbi:MAG TPA: carbamoyltransferase HypF [Streptosporangiaceae bacterium]|nr:carbamoyltransferase HypF [Streptosporangiaceae bacterium]